MIFSYREIDHKLYLFHEHIAFIFKQIFDRDLPEYEESIHVHPDFVPIINRAKVPILEPIKEIIRLYHKLPYGDKLQLQVAFSYNNSIETLINKKTIPIKFDDINSEIGEVLKKFCVDLWDKFPQVVQMGKDFGTVKDHYDKLVAESNFPGLICPFCGIDTFEPSEGKYREAYDHLIAKAEYPFASINLKLLFPACHKCNSNEKRDTDTLFKTDGKRRAVYYPYDETITADSLKIVIVPEENYNNIKLETLLRSVNWHFDLFRNDTTDERLESWDEIYGIRRKYFERLKRLEKEWFSQLFNSHKREKNLGVHFEDFQREFLKSAKYQILISGMGIIRYSYFNFLFSIPDFETKLNETISK